MDLGDFSRDDQPGYIEKFIRGDVLVTDHTCRIGRIAQTAVGLRVLRRLPAEFIHKRIVLPGKKVVIEAQTDRPIIGERHRLLSLPLGLRGITRQQYGQIAARHPRNRLQQHPGWIFRIALHALQRSLVVAIKLRGIPPCRVVIGVHLGRARQIGAPAHGELVRRCIVQYVGFIHLIAGPASQLLDLFRSQRRRDVVHQLALAADVHRGSGSVVPLVHVREPVVRHELDPVGGENVEERRLLVVAIGVGGIVGKSETRIAGGRVGLRTGEQLAADELRVRSQQTDASAVAVLGKGSPLEIGKRGFKFRVAHEWHTRRTHARVAYVIADAS